MDTYQYYEADANDSMEVEAEADDDDMSDDRKAAGDDEEVMAAVVVDDEDEEEEDGYGATAASVVEAAPVVVETTKKSKSKKSKSSSTSKKKKTPKSAASNKTSSTSKSKGATSKKKKKKKSKASSDNKGSPYSKISAERLDVAAKARTALVETIPTLPVPVADIVVRSFGRLFLEPSTESSKFSSANALYPIGFSCDRFEFSPVHGRLLKMRCSILDGRKMKAEQFHYGVPVSTWIPDGPVFRIMWGQGIDEDKDEVDYPYDPYSMSAPLTSDKVDAVAIPTTSDKSGKALVPRNGMRVRASLDRGEVEYGTITKVDNDQEATGKKKKRKQYEIEIQYDEGSTEVIKFPDPDISLLLPEAEPLLDSEGQTEHRYLNGKPVHTVLGSSPLEAWGQVLTKLGLTDEIISQSAYSSVTSAREQAFQEAKGKVEGKHKGQQAKTANKKSENGEADTQTAGETSEGGEAKSTGGENGAQGGSEPRPEEEEELRSKAADLEKELESVKAKDREATVNLAEKRIHSLGSYLCNPFPDTDPKQPQQSSWLATTVRKEKTKMGSTGNKKKIVTATDLLERNDTFYNPDIESLIEGLPGSEYCTSYVFQAFRQGGAAATSRAWVHEAQVRNEKEREKKLKATKKEKAKSSQKKEKDLKRKRLDDIRDEKKRQKVEEEEEKKKARIEERLARLQVQVDDRLFKDACAQREKAIVALSKTFTKEYNKRRRAAELVAGQSIVDNKKRRSHVPRTPYKPLPPLSKVFEEDVVRVWDFVSTFGSFFIERGYFKTLPTIESLQSAVDSLRGGSAMSKEQAVSSLTNLAMALCKPLAVSQTRLLFASLIALYPQLQKDFGAAFFNDMNETVDKDDKEKKSDAVNTDVLLPVNSMTWQEIARVAFLSDALGELGYSRHDSAHLLRGYRSAGHPNSKEARRLRRVEDYSVALLRQALSDGRREDKKRPPTVVRLEIPNTPSCYPSDWMFHLLNVRSLAPDAAGAIRKNVKKALSLLKSSSASDGHKETVATLEHCLQLLAKVETPQAKSAPEMDSCKKAKQCVVEVLEKLAAEKQDEGISNIEGAKSTTTAAQHPLETGPRRKHMGLVLNSLTLTKQEYKKLVHAREEYMSAAMKLKEDMERQARKKKKEEGADEDDEEDDDEEEEDDDDEVENNRRKSEETEGQEKDDKSVENDKASVAGSAIGKADGEVVKDSNEGKVENNGDAKVKSEAAEMTGANASSVEEKGNKNAMVLDKPISEADNGNSTAEKLGEAKSDDKATAMDAESSSDAVKGDKNADADGNVKMEENGGTAGGDPSAPKKIGKENQYDDFCEDIPTAPELIRRCLAVLRSLAVAGPSEPFIYPVDPQTNPGYYDMVLRPMCLWKAGKDLQAIGNRLSKPPNESLDSAEMKEVEAAVLQFGRNIRLISYNCLSYANAGPMVIAAGSEFLRIFERLFLDWVLAPQHVLTPLGELDDDRCVEHHASDEESTVLLCDGCEGNFNISRLDPPLTEVPKGDWFCPRCVSGRWWGHLDPRIGETVQKDVESSDAMSDKNSDDSLSQLDGQIEKCLVVYPENADSKPALMYKVKIEDGTVETWSLEQVDDALKARGGAPAPVRCVEAIAESQGYGCPSPEETLSRDLVPVPLNPNISESAAQAALSSSVFRDTITASGTLLVSNPEEMRASEWLRLLVLLVMKCASSDLVQNLASKLESEAAEAMSKNLGTQRKVSDIADVLEDVSDGDEVEEDDEVEDPAGAAEEKEEKASEEKEEKASEEKEEKASEEKEEKASEEKEERASEDVEMKDAENQEQHQTPDRPTSASNEQQTQSKGDALQESADHKTPDNKSPAIQSGKKSPTEGNAKAANDPAQTPADGQVSSSPMVVESNKPEDAPKSGPSTTEAESSTIPQEPKEIVVVDPVKERRTAALSAKAKRHKAREESISAFSMKNQLRPTVASFEEDAVSNVIDTSLASKIPGLSFASTRCRRTVCDFCGLTDTALGTPLVRVPDDDEWDEAIPHASRSRRLQIVADMQGRGIHEDSPNSLEESKDLEPQRGNLVAVSIRIGDEVVSKAQNPKAFDRTEDGGMLEFCPRNTEGFQDELSFRYSHDLPFITGSLSAHECCAIAAHNARKVYVVQHFKERLLELAEADAGMTCGRTLSIGKDALGRFYWRFNRDPSALFMYVPGVNEGGGTGEWHRFADFACIAAVILSLGKDSVVKDLKRAYPAAAQMLKDNTWRDALLKRRFPNALKPPEKHSGRSNGVESSDHESTTGFKAEEEEEEEEEEPYEVGEDVLVESKSGKLLWDATVMEVFKTKEDGPVTGYKVHYKGWSDRYDDWVSSARLVEPSENNRQVQEEMLEEAASQRDGLPSALNNMVARDFLRAKDRARGNIPLPNFASVAHVHSGASTDDRTFATMKAAVLLIEAALPLGAVDNTSKGTWNPEIAQQWRLMVEGADDAATLMRCVILLEDIITEEWYKPDVGHLRSCLPNRWKALGEASAAALALRIILLDRGILYSTVDKKRFVEKAPPAKKK